MGNIVIMDGNKRSPGFSARKSYVLVPPVLERDRSALSKMAVSGYDTIFVETPLTRLLRSHFSSGLRTSLTLAPPDDPTIQVNIFVETPLGCLLRFERFCHGTGRGDQCA